MTELARATRRSVTTERHTTSADDRLGTSATKRRPARRHNARVAPTGLPEQVTLFGRARETQLLEDVLAAARQRGGALVLLGEPGIGKSSLIDAAAANAQVSGFEILTATGVQSEAELPFAGLHQLMRPLLRKVDALPMPQREAMLAAFGRTSSTTPDLFLIALATLDLLSDAAARAPLLVVAEDAQWLDRPTCDVLTFVARRLESDPILLLVAIREGNPSSLLNAGLTELHLDPLAEPDAIALLDNFAPGLTPANRRRVLEEAQGNPLALVELPVSVGRDDLSDEIGMPTSLQLTARLERAFVSRYGELPYATQSALLVAAVDDALDLGEVLQAASVMRSRSITIADLAPAATARLAEINQNELRFRHPVIRSAVRQAASLEDRLAAHAALAAGLDDQPDRRAWHRASSVIGRDEQAARALVEAAARARGRGALSVSVSALERAAHLTPDPSRRVERLLQATELAFELGRRDVVARLVREIEPMLPLVRGPLAEARMTLVLGWGGTRVLQLHRLQSIVAIAERARDAGDVDLGWSLLWRLAQRCFWADPGLEARHVVVTAAENVGSLDGDPRALGVLAYAAPLEKANRVIDSLAHWSADSAGAEAARLLGSAAVVVGAFELSVPFLTAAAAGLREQGRLGHLARVLVMQGWSATCMANWQIALPVLDEGVRLAIETGELAWGAGGQAMKAILAALRGESEIAEDLTLQAEQSVISIGATHMLAYVQVARGLAALGDGRHVDAYAALHRIFDPVDPAHHLVPCCWYVGDLAEAAAHSDHRDEARGIVEKLEPLIAETRSSWIQAAFRFARAQLADDTAADVLFQEALVADMTRWPFQRGRLLLAYGAWLRRQRHVSESRSPLRSARDTFDALGALQWAERARQELRAAGETSRGREREAWARLSAQEIQIAALAAEGLSNREIGRRLYLSHRTVGSHLYRTFPKLGITSRGQLASVLARG
jgi:DNA-binding CsgD family transcriptional regulator